MFYTQEQDIAPCRGVGLWGGTSFPILFRLYFSLGTGVLYFVGGFCPEILLATRRENKDSWVIKRIARLLGSG